MDTTVMTKLLRIALFALREFGHQDGKAAVFVPEIIIELNTKSKTANGRRYINGHHSHD